MAHNSYKEVLQHNDIQLNCFVSTRVRKKTESTTPYNKKKEADVNP